MSRKYIPFALLALFTAMPGSSTAETVAPERMMPSPVPDRSGDSVRVQVSINFFVPGPSGESQEATNARERARRTIYETAAGECKLLQNVIAKDCRLESVNVNVHRQTGQYEGFTATGNMAYRIILK
jgi:hypothetical protein